MITAIRVRFLLAALAAGVALTGLLLPAAARAQTTTGSMRGTVTDQSGIPLQGAEIAARDLATGVQRRTLSGSRGFYVLLGLHPGDYELTARRVGSALLTRRVAVHVGVQLTLNLQLTESAVRLAEVTVVAQPVAETRTSEVATNVTQAQIQNLPSSSRNFLDLAALAPGVRVSVDRTDGTSKTFASGALGPEAVNVFIDGASLKNDVLPGGIAGQRDSRGNPFPRNAVQEFRVISSNFRAEYQRASSAIITATTRSGGTRWSGSAFVSRQSTDFLALDTFDLLRQSTDTSFRKPDYSRTLMGVSGGGPLIRDRLRFFGSFETNAQNRVGRVRFFGDPATRPAIVNAQEGGFDAPFRSYLFFSKLSWDRGPNEDVEFSVNVRRESDKRSFGGIFNCPCVSFESAENFRNNVFTGLLRHRRTWGDWLNEASLNVQRYTYNPEVLNPNLVGRDYLGFGRIGGRDTRQDFTQTRVSLRDDITYSGLQWAGQHVIKGGLNVDFLRYHVVKELFGNPLYLFRSDESYLVPFEARFGVGDPDLSTSNRQIGAYVQDDWAPTSRLTINAGVRWDFETDMFNNDYVTPQAIRDSLNLPQIRDSLLNPIPARYFTDGSNRPPFKSAFQPRLGFSYALDAQARTVLFGGVGVYYDRSPYNNGLDERFRRQYAVRTFRFSSDGLPRDGQPTIQWQDQYLTKAGLEQLIASGTAPGAEVFLLDNDTRPPRTTHWSLGVRRVLGPYLLSVTSTAIRSKNGLTFIFGNRRLDGNCCFGIPAYGNVLLSSDAVRTWYDALQVKIERPYGAGGARWGAGLSYTLSEGTQIGGDLFSFDFKSVGDYPRYPTGDDQRHTVVGNWIADFPWGIQFSGLLTLGSGTPYTIADASFGFGPNQFRTRRGEGRPQKDAFLIPGAWAFRNVDLRLRKDVPIRGGRLGLVADVFNVFNFQNFGCFDSFIRPLTDAGGPNPRFGMPNCVVSDARRLQLGAQYDF